MPRMVKDRPGDDPTLNWKSRAAAKGEGESVAKT